MPDLEDLELKLANNATCRGIACIAPPSNHQLQGLVPRPLVVALHGGTCTPEFYRLTEAIATISSLLSISFVAIERPGYGDSDAFLPLDEGKDFWSESARWLNCYILPALWKQFGHDCTAIVLDAHSMAVPITIVTAVEYSRTPDKEYPLAGLILSGWGAELNNNPHPLPEHGDSHRKPSLETKKLMMLSEDEHDCHTSETLEKFLEHPNLNVGTPRAEVESFFSWFQHESEYKAAVTQPIMYSMGMHDWLWKATPASIEVFQKTFSSCQRFDTSLVLGASHMMEISRCAYGYGLRCFGWATEVCTHFANEHENNELRHKD